MDKKKQKSPLSSTHNLLQYRDIYERYCLDEKCWKKMLQQRLDSSRNPLEYRNIHEAHQWEMEHVAKIKSHLDALQKIQGSQHSTPHSPTNQPQHNTTATATTTIKSLQQEVTEQYLAILELQKQVNESSQEKPTK